MGKSTYLSRLIIRHFSVPFFLNKLQRSRCSAYSLHNERVSLIKSDFSFLSQGRSLKNFHVGHGGIFFYLFEHLTRNNFLTNTMSELSPQGLLAFFLVKMFHFSGFLLTLNPICTEEQQLWCFQIIDLNV